MPLPNYKNGSIVNLMSSVEKALGGNPQYNTLPMLTPDEIKQYDTVVLLVIDGLGYEYIKKYGKSSMLWKNLRGKITSVFPSETTTAMTALTVGVPAQQHALTGWFMYLKEFKRIMIVLPFVPRIKDKKFKPTKNDVKKIFTQKSIFKKIQNQSYQFLALKNYKSYRIVSKKYVNGECTKATNGPAKRIGYTTMTHFFELIKKTIARERNKKLIHAYWPAFDTMSHIKGPKDPKTRKHFQSLDRQIRYLAKKARKTNTLLLITADHGQIAIPPERTIFLDQHPEMKAMLTQPLCAWRRTVYCYVKKGKEKQFEKYVKTKLGKYCTLYKSKDLIKKHYFGLFTPNKKLKDRIGDYTLIMKDNYEIAEVLPGEKMHFCRGDHGGISKEEMFVPLIVIDCKKLK